MNSNSQPPRLSWYSLVNHPASTFSTSPASAWDRFQGLRESSPPRSAATRLRADCSSVKFQHLPTASKQCTAFDMTCVSILQCRFCAPEALSGRHNAWKGRAAHLHERTRLAL